MTVSLRGETWLVGRVLIVAISAFGTLCLVYWHAAFGIGAPFSTIIGSILAAPVDDPAGALLHYLRLPRTLAAIVTGACLAAAGTLFQAATRNPLASPGILGVTAGAQLFVALVTVVPAFALIVPHTMAATMGGLTAGCITWMVSRGSGAGPVRIALSGMAVSLMAGAAAAALALLDESTGASLHLWGGGSLVQADWRASIGALIGFLPAILLMLILARQLDILALGDDTARMLGQNLFLVRGAALVLGVWLSALAVTLAGPVVFVGLVAPNLLRMAGVSRHIVLLPSAIIAGIALTVGADLLVLRLSASTVELPVGVPVALVGAPVLVLLAWRHAGESRAVTEFADRYRMHHALPKASRVIFLFVLLATACLAGIMSGNDFIDFGSVGAFLTGSAAADLHNILELRALRVTGSALGGALLALSGLLLQGVIRNPLASPELVGVTQTSGLFAVVALLLFPEYGFLGVQAAAIAGGLGAALLVANLGLRSNLAPSAMALIGLGLAAFAASAATTLVIGGGFQASQAATWLAGSTYGVNATDLIILTGALFGIIPAAYLLLSVTDMLGFGRSKASSLGLNVRMIEWAHLLIGALCASLVAAVFGPVSFVGLMAPHAARLLNPGRQRDLLAASMIIGAALMVIADGLGRTLFAPIEIPVGLMTAIIGAPFILLILRRA
ncbi:iron ABC transporter permease [Phyllobacterium sp. YR531]|uniref:iron ABC transporter permease n=1 Tax=Phyllobacterium sp. YR531 TaxID=1144343 RepID=UPI00026FCBA7|nr:iron ABC transporter permease [Phyllobacterium sp. YR531]EJN06841.1 ABC-type Fe3+-siderophore transport system, permease component [Phyllobacterium sp. YR531]